MVSVGAGATHLPAEVLAARIHAVHHRDHARVTDAHTEGHVEDAGAQRLGLNGEAAGPEGGDPHPVIGPCRLGAGRVGGGILLSVVVHLRALTYSSSMGFVVMRSDIHPSEQRTTVWRNRMYSASRSLRRTTAPGQ